MGLKEDLRYQFIEEARTRKILHSTLISESAENYARTLFGLKDYRKEGHGPDAIDTTFIPPIHYEIKENKLSIVIKDTQLHYQYDTFRSYLIAVKRVDKITSYKKHKHRKILKTINEEDSLLFDFGDIFVMPFEILRMHYILQRARQLGKKHVHDIGEGKKYKDLRNMHRVMRYRSEEELKQLEKRILNGESISHNEINLVTLTFSQAAQIIIQYGPEAYALRSMFKHKKLYQWKVINGPLILSTTLRSKIFLMDQDYKVIDDLVSRLNVPVDGLTRVQEMDDVKKERLKFYDIIRELQSKDFLWHIDKHPKLKSKLEDLVKWQYSQPFQGDLFTQYSKEDSEPPF